MRILYRGAMQFVRNLIEYQASTAQIQLRLIDTMLRLVAETQVHNEDDVTIGDIRRMLKRIPISNGQLELYRVLYAAGEKGLIGSELSTQMN